MRVEFVVSFMDWKRGDVADLPKDLAERYIGRMGVATVHKPPAKRAKALRNKMETGSSNK
jgi:hypothetical protein